MSNNRVMSEKIAVVLEKLNSFTAQDQAQLSAHQGQVSNLQMQNFFRRNKPQVIAASSILLSLLLIGAGVYAAMDYRKIPSVPFGDVDPNLERKNIDTAIFVSTLSVGIIFFIATNAMICVRAHKISSCLSSMNELPMPQAPLPTTISDHLTEDQKNKLLQLSIHLVDAMDAQLEHDQKAQFKLFYPRMDSKFSPEEALNSRVIEIKKSISTEKLIAVLTQFQSHLEKNKLSKKSEEAISSALDTCLIFCRSSYMTESSPLLGISIRQ